MTGIAVEDDLLGGRYRLLAPLGSGGMATVFQGRDERLDRTVAIKLLRPDLARDPALRRRFENEARAAARLSHPNVVAVYDAGEDEGRSFIVMECLRGESLADVIHHGPVDEDWLRRMADEVLSALGAAHAAGIIHRDIKPGNILLGPDGRAKVGDFGIASVAEWQPVAGADGDHTAAALTGAGLVLGTVAYLAPERAMGAPATVQSDLYSLGVVLYEALTGTKPYTGATPAAIATAALHRAAQDPRTLRPGADPALVATIGRAMNPNPELRYPSDAAMASDLSRPLPAPTDIMVAAPAAAAAFAATEALEPGHPGVGVFVGGAPVTADLGPAVAPPAGPAVAPAVGPAVAPPVKLAGAPPVGPAVAPPAGPWPATQWASAALRRTPWQDRRWQLVGAAAVVVVVIAVALLLANPAPRSSATTATTLGRATTTVPTDPTAVALRSVAHQVAATSSPQAPALATGLDTVAATADPAARSTAASNLLAQATQWYQQGQLSYQDYILAAGVLHQAGAPQAPATATSSAPAPAPAPVHTARHGGHGKAKS